MGLTKIYALAMSVLFALATGAAAKDYALVIANQNYAQFGAEPDAASFEQVADLLRNDGFQVFGAADMNALGMIHAAQSFRKQVQSGNPDRVIVVLSGRIASGRTDAWLLPTNHPEVSDLTIGRHGLSLAVLDGVLQAVPGRGLMVIAPAWQSKEAPGVGLRSGVFGVKPGQGVTHMTGKADRVVPILRTEIVIGGTPIGKIAASKPKGVRFSGFLSPDTPFGASVGDAVAQSDAAYWSAAHDIHSVSAYEAYLKRFPNGIFAAEARRAIQALKDEPQRQAQAAEQALGLTRAMRRQIQSDLTLLGFDTKGVDGIFGDGSRTAIKSFQTKSGLPATSYLTAQQVAQIDHQAGQIRAEQRRKDEAYWLETGALGTEQGYRSYLDKYPRGLHAQEAKDAVTALDSAREHRAAWARAMQLDSLEEYRRFVDRYPNSEFLQRAQSRIAELEPAEIREDQLEQYRAEENAIASNPVARLLVEKGLAKAGFDPGKVDGKFNKATRKALRQFQRDAQLPVSGLVTQHTMMRLTASVLR